MNYVSIEELRNQYYEAIKLLYCNNETVHIIEEKLPKPDFINFFPIMEGLISKLKEEQLSIKELIQETDEDEKDFLQTELDSCNYKLRICLAILQKAQEAVTIESDEKSKKNLIFAISEAGNVLIKRDISTIPEEYYQSIIDCLKMIEDGQNENNPEFSKKLNDNLSRFHEVKLFKIRIYYRVLSSDCAYVFMVKTKKSNNDLFDRTAISDRFRNLERRFNVLIKAIQDDNYKKRLIAEHEEIKKEIMELLHSKKR